MRAGAKAKGRERFLRTLRHIERSREVTTHQQRCTGRDNREQPLKGILDMIEVPIHVGMIEFPSIQQYRLRTIVQKLWPFVEERSVVFVTLDDKKLTFPESVALRKIPRHPANKQAWLSSGLFQHPTEKSSRGRLTMRPNDNQWPLPFEKKVTQCLGKRLIRNLTL